LCQIASQEILPTPTKQHQKTQRLTTLTEVEKLLPGLAAFIDATEQEIPRPKNKRKRKTHYSGKKKKYTVKTQLTVNKRGLIVHKLVMYLGVFMIMLCISVVILNCPKG